MKILITGCAGFIGFHTAKKFLKNNCNVVGIDSLNNYYSLTLKKNRIQLLNQNKNFKFYKINISSSKQIKKIFQSKFDIVINLAAQAGVRYSIKNPKAYTDSNISGFLNILENIKLKNKNIALIYASTSSVYGDSKNKILDEKVNTSNPIQYYAVTKKTNELMAHAYYKLFNISSIGLRFFTVYGPYGRPDMALFRFTKNIINNKPIDVYNFGNHYRDFTYVDDISESIFRLAKKIKKRKKNIFEIFNIGNGFPIKLGKFISIIEKSLNKKAKKNFINLQKGDIVGTHASSKKLFKYINYKPKTNVQLGIKNFVKWYLEYYRIRKF